MLNFKHFNCKKILIRKKKPSYIKGPCLIFGMKQLTLAHAIIVKIKFNM